MKPDAPRTSSSRGVWVAAIGLAVAWHAGWGLILKPAPIPAAAYRADPPVITVRPMAMQSMDDPKEVNMALVRSPALFSLPSPFGFSRPILEEAADVGPPLEQAQVSGVLLARADATSASLYDAPTRLRAPAAARLDASVSRMGYGAATPGDSPALPEGSGLSILVNGGLSEAEFEGVDLSGLNLSDPASWTMVLYIETGSMGDVIRVIAEPGSDALKDKERIIRTVYSWRLKTASARSGRIVIRNNPPRSAGPGEKG